MGKETSMATYFASQPSCVGRTLLSKPPTLSQWLTCAQQGWDEKTSTAARLGLEFGHTVLPALIVLAVIFLAVRALIRP
jgi:hypothetical protein